MNRSTPVRAAGRLHDSLLVRPLPPGRSTACRLALLLALLLLATAAGPLTAQDATPPGPTLGKAGSYSFTLEVEVPGTPEAAFDLFTGDVSGWWDHHFMEKPKALYIEPRPGGGFLEIFDDEGNGALHATVIYAQRGRRLVMSGPLGFSGFAHEIVSALDFTAVEGSDSARTRIKATIHAGGELADGWAEAVRGVWHHFLVERFQPYVVRLAASSQPDQPSQPHQPNQP